LTGLVNQLTTDSMLTIAPPPPAASTGANARHMASVPK
jgi:hypothetical protein